MSFTTVTWDRDAVVLIDQTRLPLEESYVRLEQAEEVAVAIETMVVRGAPAIGVTAALGIALGLYRYNQQLDGPLTPFFETICQRMARTRPTAVNLFWAIDRMRASFSRCKDQGNAAVSATILAEALLIAKEDEEACRRLGDHGATLFTTPTTILTHCNAGGLATAGYGTALGVIRSAYGAGMVTRVFADETRPWLQGARLTAWELHKDGIPVTLIADTMAGHLMAQGEIGCVVVGADRIAANGDTANKIGTYQLAIMAKEHGIPFYIAAPLSTVDMATDDGSAIPIEERSPLEVTHIRSIPIAPPGVEVRNPSFDVTPARYIHAIITEGGIARPPFKQSLMQLMGADHE